MNSVHAGASFLEGLASFFSPCTVAVLPVFLAYFSSAKEETRSRGKTLLRTAFFVLGISFAIVLLALAASTLGNFLKDYRGVLQLTAGILIILIGLSEAGIIQIAVPWNTSALTDKVTAKPSDILTSFLLGFLYSFSFTPCVGPALTSIVLLAASEPRGYLYLLIYLAGFCLPFLALGLFTEAMTSWISRHKKAFRILKVISAAVLVFIGGYVFYGGIQTYRNLTANADAGNAEVNRYDFELTGYDGKTYRLTDFRGKPIVLNFFTTWCVYCPEEIESMKTLSGEYPDIQFIGVMELSTESEEEIRKYVEDKQIPYTIVLDPGGRIGDLYGVSGYPTTFFIKKDFNFLGYAPGAMGEESLREVFNELMGGN